jgi:hypothetical protein
MAPILAKLMTSELLENTMEEPLPALLFTELSFNKSPEVLVPVARVMVRGVDGAVVPIPTLPLAAMVIRVASVSAVVVPATVPLADAVWNKIAPDVAVPVPLPAWIVKLAPEISVPEPLAPRIVAALGVAPSPAP